MEEIPLKYGYELYDGPIVERRILYEVKSGGEIVGEVFEVKGKSKEKLVLRPEMTPTLGRLIARMDQELVKPVRWATISRYFRDETPQRGRVKEFWQLNVDIIGLDSAYADAEVITILHDILIELGLKKTEFQIYVNDRRILEAVLKKLGITNIDEVYPILDKKDKLLQEELKKQLGKAGLKEKEIELLSLKFRKFDKYKEDILSQYKGNKEILKISKDLNQIRKNAFVRFLVEKGINESNAEKLFDISEIHGPLKEALFELEKYVSEFGVEHSVFEHIKELEEYLESFGVIDTIILDASIVRGFAYYTGIIFEAFDSESLIPRALAGGGRYDNLVSVLGGPQIPATGFGMGETVILEILKEKNRLQGVSIGIPEIGIRPLNRNTMKKAHEIAQILRKSGKHVLFMPPKGKLGKTIEHFAKRGVRYLVIVGEKDLEKQAVTIKDLETGEQEQIAIKELERYLNEIIKN